MVTLHSHAAPSARSADALNERGKLGVVNADDMFWLRISARGDVGLELREGGEAFSLQPVQFGAEIAVDLGVARLVAARVAKHILGKQILRIGIYNVAAGNLGIAEALKDEGLKGSVVFIGHELNTNSRMLLETDGMDYVIAHDVDTDVAMAFDMLRKFFEGTSTTGIGKTPVRIYTKYNCR